MATRLLSLLMLFVFSVMTSSSMLLTVIANENAEHESPVLYHDNGVPCPDSDNGVACDDGCPCFFCPGHITMILTSMRLSLATPPLAESRRLEFSDTLHPKDDFRRIFRPPRA